MTRSQTRQAETETGRGTGRTTGLMLQALGKALTACGKEVEFVDHTPHTYASAHAMQRRLTQIVSSLGLCMQVNRYGAKLFVHSMIREAIKRRGKA